MLSSLSDTVSGLSDAGGARLALNSLLVGIIIGHAVTALSRASPRWGGWCCRRRGGSTHVKREASSEIQEEANAPTASGRHAVAPCDDGARSYQRAYPRCSAALSEGRVLGLAATVMRLTYYNNGRMRSAKVGSSTMTYVDNALGQRIKKSGGSPRAVQQWFSDTYVRTPGGWRYVFGQLSLPMPKDSRK